MHQPTIALRCRKPLDRRGYTFQRSALPVAIAACCLWAAPSARGQQYAGERSQQTMDTTVSVKFMLGIAGEVELDDVPLFGSVEDDLEPTLGGGVEVDFPLHKYFLLGGMFGFHSWIWEGAEDADWDRGFLLDFSVVPKGRYPLEKTPVALYLGLPIGLCLDLFDEDNLPAFEVDVGLGLNFSVLAGVQVELASSVGLLAELGYTLHSFSHDLEPSGGGASVEVDALMEQFALNVGVYFM